MKSIIGLLISMAVIVTIPACGGGGGGGGYIPPVQPTTAVVTLSTQGTTTFSIGAVQATLTLPAGVTVKATQNAPETDAGVVTSSVGDQALGNYNPASSTVEVNVTKAATTGMAKGVFATVNCDIAAGSFPSASSFSVSNLKTWDATTLAPFNDLTVTSTATIN